MSVMAQPYKHPKTGVYQVRRAVPKALREIVGKHEIKRSLGTKSLAEARKLYPTIYAGIDAEFEKARLVVQQRQQYEEKALTQPDNLNLRDIKILAARYYNQELKRMMDSPTLGTHDMLKYDMMIVRLNAWQVYANAVPDEVATAVNLANDLSASEVPLDVNAELYELFADDAENLFREANRAVPRDSEQFKRLLQAIAEVIPKLRQDVIDLVRLTGTEPQLQPMANAELSQSNTESPNVVRLYSDKKKTEDEISSVFERYKVSMRLHSTKNERTVDKTLRDYSIAIKRFIEFTGDKSIAEVTKRDINEFRAILLQLPSRPTRDVAGRPLNEQIDLAQRKGLTLLSPKTVRKQLMAVSSLFEYAVENELCASNPVHGATKRLTLADERNDGSQKQYNAEQLKRIFSSGIFTDNHRPKTGVYGEAVYWLPLLAYYTGARVEELAQLYVRDIKQENDIAYIHIIADSSDKSVKNKSSVRRVPLHVHLLELGFLDYVAQQPSDGRVFPKLKQGGDGRFSGRVSKWLGEYFREELKLGSNAKPMHGFRHSFKTIARDVGIPKEISDRITGHSSGDVADTYGEYSLELMSRELNKIPKLAL